MPQLSTFLTNLLHPSTRLDLFDPFTAANGALTDTSPAAHGGRGSLVWTAPNWLIAGNVAAAAPSTGAELLTNADFELDANWPNYASPTSNTRSSAQARNGTYSRQVIGAASSGCGQVVTGLTVGAWYLASAYIYVASGTGGSAGLGTYTGPVITTLTTWSVSRLAKRADATSLTLVGIARYGNATVHVDDASLKRLTLTDLFATLETNNNGAAGLAVSATIAPNNGQPTGLVMCLDSTTSPQNCVIAYADKTNIYLDKIVGGTSTSLQTTTITQGASGRLGLARSGSTFSVTYNGQLVGAAQTIADAGILSGTRHGLFSATPDAALEDFRMRPARPQIVTILGDDLSDSLDATTDWPYYLARSSTVGACQIKNRATATHTIAANMDAQTTAAASDNADIIVVALGGLDADAAGVQAEYEENITELAASNPSAAIYALGILPNTTNAAARTANNPRISAAVSAAAAGGARAVYVDTTDWIVPATDTSDGYKTNATGAAKVSAQIIARIAP